MDKLLMLLFMICTLTVNVQTVNAQIERPDTVIHEKCYVSYYSYKIKAPAYVVYKLYKGGGNVSRRGMTFKSKLSHFYYKGSGYDIGHLCNAEDFAYNRELEESTFRYYNALPQTPNLNRGIWKVLETRIRKNSQTDSLLIICGGEEFKTFIPDKCFKVVYSLSTGKMLYSIMFTNKQVGNIERNVRFNFDFDKLRKIEVIYK